MRLERGLKLREAKPVDLRNWELATAQALAAIQDELLDPLLDQYPEIKPVELGGPPKPATKGRSRRREQKR